MIKKSTKQPSEKRKGKEKRENIGRKEKEKREMFYSYGKFTQGWNEEKKDELFQKLVQLIKSVNPDNNRYWVKIPWIQKDGLHGSVTIRKITHLKSKDREKLVDKADAIYNEVMGLPEH